MKKRLVALAIILALTLGMATTALANPTDIDFDGTGTVRFKEGEITIIPPPDDDPDCPIRNPFGINGKNIDFGYHEVSINDETHWAALNPGVTLYSARPSATNITVSVSVGGFFSGLVPTMEDFEIYLLPYDTAGHKTNNAATVLVSGTGGTQIAPNVGIGDGDAAINVMTVTIPADSSEPNEFYGGEWGAGLLVLGGSVTVVDEDAIAPMTWNLIHD